MGVRRVGTWKDAARRLADAALAATLPGGWRLFSFLAQVDGYLFPQEAVFLYWLARLGPGTGSIVEIGSFRGRSTLCLAAGVRGLRETRILAVDPHVYRTEKELRENLLHFDMAGVVDLVALPSVEAAREWRGRARIVFVDGNHEKASVEADVNAWLPFLEPGGFLLLHDSTGLSSFPGPKEVAEAQLHAGPVFDAVGHLGAITWARRSGAREPWSPPSYGGAVLDRFIAYVKNRRRDTRGLIPG